jgi:hypothetical protein
MASICHIEIGEPKERDTHFLLDDRKAVKTTTTEVVVTVANPGDARLRFGRVI